MEEMLNRLASRPTMGRLEVIIALPARAHASIRITESSNVAVQLVGVPEPYHRDAARALGMRRAHGDVIRFIDEDEFLNGSWEDTAAFHAGEQDSTALPGEWPRRLAAGGAPVPDPV